MKILVSGANGQVGWELVQKGADQGHEIIGCTRAELDIGNQPAVTAKIRETAPDLVINCAAYTAVDKAETDEENAFRVNRDGPAWLAEECAARRIPLIHLSTDYVFDGSSSRPYREDDPVNPLGVYGKSKEAGERQVRQRLTQHLIIRTSWVFGNHGHNFVKTMMKLGREREELRVVADQWGCPTFAGDLADGLLKICRKIQAGRDIDWGTYHFCGATTLSWHEFAQLIFAKARKKLPLRVKKVLPITTAEFPTPAQRPKYSTLDCTLIKNTFDLEGADINQALSCYFLHS